VKIAIDDFGTGYSSLSLLSEIPVDTIKIDQSFVTDVAKRPEPGRLIRAIQSLASDFGLRTVAEGVEDLDQLKALEGLDCQAAQGFYFARPQPAKQLAELLGRDRSISAVTT
jgi:EAL domain-containing protein (putative c-di-GMP-specific phosphodiesterase class I)